MVLAYACFARIAQLKGVNLEYYSTVCCQPTVSEVESLPAQIHHQALRGHLREQMSTVMRISRHSSTLFFKLLTQAPRGFSKLGFVTKQHTDSSGYSGMRPYMKAG